MSNIAIQEQQTAPDFTLPAVGKEDIVKNGQVHLEDLKGHTVVDTVPRLVAQHAGEYLCPHPCYPK